MFGKKQIVSAIAALGRKLGRTPTLSQFGSLAGITQYRVSLCFPTWTDAVRAAGLQPYTLNAKVEDRALLEDWGNLARRNRRIPTRDAYRREGKYSPNTIRKRVGRWSSVPEAFRNFAKGKREWKDVLALLPAPGTARVRRAPRLKAGRHRANNNSASPLPPDKTRHAQHAPPHKQLHLPLKDRTTYGDLIVFAVMRREPVDEQGVVLLFGMLAQGLGYMVEHVQRGFPDCEAMREISPKRWQRLRIEFEYESRNFRDHGHPLTGCDVIVCWRHNWKECPKHLEVLELSRVIKDIGQTRDGSEPSHPPGSQRWPRVRPVETWSDASPIEARSTVACGAVQIYAAERGRSPKWKFPLIAWVQGREMASKSISQAA